MILTDIGNYQFKSQFGEIYFDVGDIIFSQSDISLSLIGDSFLISSSSNSIENTFLSNGIHKIEGTYNLITYLDENSEITGNGLIQDLIILSDNSAISPDLVSSISYLPSDILQIQNFTSSFDSELNILLDSSMYSRLIIEPNDNINGRIFINIDYISLSFPLIPGSIYYPIHSMNEDLESKELFYVRKPDNTELLVSNCSIATNIENESFRLFFDSSIGFGMSALVLKANSPPIIQNLTCSITCSRDIDCICCTEFVSSILDPDLSECPESFSIADNSNGLFMDPQDSTMVCYTESSIQGSIQELIEYQVEDLSGDLSNIAYIDFTFNVPSLSPTPSISKSPTTSPTSSITSSISKSVTESSSTSSTPSNTPSISLSQSITPKESLILVRPTFNSNLSIQISKSSINQIIPSLNVSPSSTNIPTAAIGGCTNSNCIIGSTQSNLDSENQIIELISENGNTIGALIVPNTIAPQGIIYVSYISNIDVDTNDISLGNSIFDISITDKFGLPVNQFKNSMTICFEEDNDIDVCIILIFIFHFDLILIFLLPFFFFFIK